MTTLTMPPAVLSALMASGIVVRAPAVPIQIQPTTPEQAAQLRARGWK